MESVASLGWKTVSLRTIADLKTSLAAWLDRDDLTDRLGDFIRLAGQRIYRSARTPVNERILGPATTTDSQFELPSSLMEIRWITVDGTKLTPASGDEVIGTLGGKPQFYGRIGDQIRFYPQTNVTFFMAYYFIDSFTADTDTPVMLQVAEDAFLYGALVEATPFLQDDSRLVVWESKYQIAMAGLKSAAGDADLATSIAIRSS